MLHKCSWQATLMNWWVILCCDPSSAAGTMPWRGWPDNYRWGPGARGKGWDRQGTGLWLGLGQASEVVPPGRQMEDFVNWSCSVQTAQSATPEESDTWDLNNPWITWLLSLQVPPVKSRLALPNRKTDCIICPGALHATDLCLLQMKAAGVDCRHQAVSMVLRLMHFNKQHELFYNISSNILQRDQSGLLNCENSNNP